MPTEDEIRRIHIDTKCVCGWLFPMALVPMRSDIPYEELGEEEHIMPGACVSLQCPVCHKCHVFYQPHEAPPKLFAKKGG